MALTAPYYFTGKDYIFAFGCAVPFGLTARQMDAWMEHGAAEELTVLGKGTRHAFGAWRNTL